MCAGGKKKSMHSHSATHLDVDPMLNALRIGTAVQGCSNKHGLGKWGILHGTVNKGFCPEFRHGTTLIPLSAFPTSSHIVEEERRMYTAPPPTPRRCVEND